MNEKDVARKIPLAQRLSMDAYTSSYFKEIYKYISILYDNCLFNNNGTHNLPFVDTTKIEKALRLLIFYLIHLLKLIEQNHLKS